MVDWELRGGVDERGGERERNIDTMMSETEREIKIYLITTFMTYYMHTLLNTTLCNVCKLDFVTY